MRPPCGKNAQEVAKCGCIHACLDDRPAIPNDDVTRRILSEDASRKKAHRKQDRSDGVPQSINNVPPHQNLWVNFGSGSFPRA